MKKLLAIAIVGTFGLGVATSAHATVEDAYPEIPDNCLVPLPQPVGPARAAHSPGGAPEIDAPDCADLDVCIVLPTLINEGTGPSRRPHVESAEDCGDVPEECIIDLRDVGPARGVHSVGFGPAPTPTPTITPEIRTDLPVPISQECQALLAESLAEAPQVPTVGSDNTPTILMASALVLTGGLLILGQRRLARR